TLEYAGPIDSLLLLITVLLLRQVVSNADIYTISLHDALPIYFKEEAGRRGAAGRLLPGTAENTKAADQLADEVAAMANTPGGGALIIGVEDRSGDLLGTDLDIEWLRQQIYRRVEVAPEIEARVEQGIRLLVIYTAEAREPVDDTSGRIRWRVGAASVPVDRGEWWAR